MLCGAAAVIASHLFSAEVIENNLSDINIVSSVWMQWCSQGGQLPPLVAQLLKNMC